VTRYRHTQPGTMTLLALLGAFALVMVAAARAAWHPVMAVVLVTLGLLALLFCSLTVRIQGRWLECFFGIGVIRKKIALADIVGARQVRNRWYYGWGVRMTPGGWMFNVSGLDAVELELASGKRFRIGTDRPQELLRAIEQARGMTDYAERSAP
jgi:hypothetical protein